MEQIDKSYRMINEEELKKTIATINSCLDNNQNIENSLISRLEEISKTVNIDNKALDNNIKEVYQNIQTLNTNFNDSVRIFNSLINKYKEALKVWIEK